MKLRFQCGAVLAACLMAVSVYSPAFGQTFREIAQTAAQQRRAQRQLKREQALKPTPLNPMRPGVNPGNPQGPRNPNNLAPQAIERLQDMPPDRQEKFLQNNQRFQNLAPGSTGADSPAPPGLEQADSLAAAGLARAAAGVGTVDSPAAAGSSPDAASAVAAVAAATPSGNYAAIAFAA